MQFAAFDLTNASADSLRRATPGREGSLSALVPELPFLADVL